MVLDWLYLIFLVLFLYRGYRKGLIRSVFSILAVVIAMVVAVQLSGSVSSWYVQEHPSVARWAPFVIYLLIFFAVAWLIRRLARMMQKMVESVAMGWLNRLFGALVYGLLITLVFSVALWLFEKMTLVGPTTIAESTLYPYVAPWAGLFFKSFGKIIPFISTSYEQLNQMFDTLSQRIH